MTEPMPLSIETVGDRHRLGYPPGYSRGDLDPEAFHAAFERVREVLDPDDYERKTTLAVAHFDEDGEHLEWVDWKVSVPVRAQAQEYAARLAGYRKGGGRIELYRL